MIKIRRGLALPISGEPQQEIHTAEAVRSVALLGGDYVGMKPAMMVQAGDEVKTGQVLFTDKKNPEVAFTSPAGGTISAINRGVKRSLVSVVIDVDEHEGHVSFPVCGNHELDGLETATIRRQLTESGLWTAFRTRPFSRIPAPDSQPSAIFVTTMDTNPLAADPRVILDEYSEDFTSGLSLVARLTEGKVFLCTAPGVVIDKNKSSRIHHEEFDGCHPAGLVGTHIHFLMPASASRVVWHIDYQDVIAIAKLFLTGRLWVERIIAIGGPPVKKPRLLRTRLGANLEELAADETSDGEVRLISGSVLAGHRAHGPVAFLGRYHRQLSILREDSSRQFLGYLSPGMHKHSVLPIYLSRFLPRRLLDFSTTRNGSPRGMVPVDSYEHVMPLDILATQLLRALLTNDIERAIELGCLELDEEDIALCTYACPAKYEYGPILRNMLTRIEQEG